MKKIIKQDGVKKVFIDEDGNEIPFSKAKKEVKKEDPEVKKEKKSIFKKSEEEQIIDED